MLDLIEEIQNMFQQLLKVRHAQGLVSAFVLGFINDLVVTCFDSLRRLPNPFSDFFGARNP